MQKTLHSREPSAHDLQLSVSSSPKRWVKAGCSPGHQVPGPELRVGALSAGDGMGLPCVAWTFRMRVTWGHFFKHINLWIGIHGF